MHRRALSSRHIIFSTYISREETPSAPVCACKCVCASVRMWWVWRRGGGGYTWAAIRQFSPMVTLWATWIMLSSLVWAPMEVSRQLPRSIVQFAPTSTCAPIITRNSCKEEDLEGVRGSQRCVACLHFSGCEFWSLYTICCVLCHDTQSRL